MITLTVVLAFLHKLKTWAWENKLVLGMALVVTLLLLWLLFGQEPQKPDIKIYDPRTEINAIQRERDEKIGTEFNAIDRQRQADDNRIKEANRRPSVSKNVNAKELEEMLKK